MMCFSLQGHYALISLSGSFQQPENNSGGIGISGLSVSLVGLDGIVVGGKFAGKLIASSTIQVLFSNCRQFILNFKQRT